MMGLVRTYPLCGKHCPPGDLRNVLIAMSDMPRFNENILQYRFDESDGEFAGHPLGNLIIAAVAEMQGSTYRAIQTLSQFFHTDGKIYPSSDMTLTLHAVLRMVMKLQGRVISLIIKGK